MKIIKILFAYCTLLFMSISSLCAQSNHPHGTHIHPKGYAVFKQGENMREYEFNRRQVGDKDILIEILYSGICHSDIHWVNGDWGVAPLPFVPGHEDSWACNENRQKCDKIQGG